MLCVLMPQQWTSVYAVRDASVRLVHRDAMGVATAAVSSAPL